MKQESLPGRDPREIFGQAPRLACKNQRRKGGKLLLDIAQCGPVRIVRHLLDRLVAPSIRRPTLGHHTILLRDISGMGGATAHCGFGAAYTRRPPRNATAKVTETA
jgi:hypothetical protein